MVRNAASDFPGYGEKNRISIRPEKKLQFQPLNIGMNP